MFSQDIWIWLTLSGPRGPLGLVVGSLLTCRLFGDGNSLSETGKTD